MTGPHTFDRYLANAGGGTDAQERALLRGARRGPTARGSGENASGGADAQQRALGDRLRDDALAAAGEWQQEGAGFLPGAADLAGLPDDAWLLRLEFTLARPFTSRAEGEFHPYEYEPRENKWYEVQNPIVRDHLTGLPLVKPATWKGHLRLAAELVGAPPAAVRPRTWSRGGDSRPAALLSHVFWRGHRAAGGDPSEARHAHARPWRDRHPGDANGLTGDVLPAVPASPPGTWMVAKSGRGGPDRGGERAAGDVPGVRLLGQEDIGLGHRPGRRSGGKRSVGAGAALAAGRRRGAWDVRGVGRDPGAEVPRCVAVGAGCPRRPDRGGAGDGGGGWLTG